MVETVKTNILVSLSLVSYSRVSNNRDHHGTFTSPKVTHITLLLANITHTRAARVNFSQIFLLVKVSEKSSQMHWVMLLIQVQNHLHCDQNDFMSYIMISDYINPRIILIMRPFLTFNCSFIGRNG